MSMEIIVESRELYSYLKPIGKIDSQTSSQLSEEVEKNLTSAGYNVIDFSLVPYISSAGLRVIMVAAKRISHGGGQFVLVGMNDFVREIFDISGFNKILAIYDNIEQAEQYLANKPPSGGARNNFDLG